MIISKHKIKIKQSLARNLAQTEKTGSSLVESILEFPGICMFRS